MEEVSKCSALLLGLVGGGEAWYAEYGRNFFPLAAIVLFLHFVYSMHAHYNQTL